MINGDGDNMRFGLAENRRASILLNSTYGKSVPSTKRRDIRQFSGAEYIGPIAKYHGLRALLIVNMADPAFCVVQFNDLRLPKSMTHAWTPFPTVHWFLHAPECA